MKLRENVSVPSDVHDVIVYSNPVKDCRSYDMTSFIVSRFTELSFLEND